MALWHYSDYALYRAVNGSAAMYLSWLVVADWRAISAGTPVYSYQPTCSTTVQSLYRW